MRISALVVLAFALGGCQTENSSSKDADTYSSIGGSPGFAEARTIFSNSCANCHDYHAVTEDQLKAEGVLVGGDPSASKLYYRLSGAPGGNMPQGGALSTSDVQAISDWISNVP